MSRWPKLPGRSLAPTTATLRGQSSASMCAGVILLTRNRGESVAAPDRSGTTSRSCTCRIRQGRPASDCGGIGHHVRALEHEGRPLRDVLCTGCLQPGERPLPRLHVELRQIAEQDARNSRPDSVPATGVSGETPAATRCAGLKSEPDTVSTPARRPGGNTRSTMGTSIRLDAATGTSQAAASSAWNSERKPQLVVMPSAPACTSERAASRKGSSSPCARSCTTRRGDAPGTTA